MNTLVPGHFDNPPANAITAEQVRAMKVPNGMGDISDEAELYGDVLRALLTHPGVSSTARAVIEAALE